MDAKPVPRPSPEDLAPEDLAPEDLTTERQIAAAEIKGAEEMNNPNAQNTRHTIHEVSQPVLEMSALIADLQHQANALKAQKGPASQEAKQRVKYNALRHGFTAQVLIMTPEEREKIRRLRPGHDDRSRPHRHPRNLPRQLHRRRSMAPESDPRPLR